MPNDLEIRVQCGVCGATAQDGCPNGGPGDDTVPDGCAAHRDGDYEAFIPLRIVPEAVIEEIRAERLDTVIEGEAKELPSAPETKPATEEDFAAAAKGEALGIAEPGAKSPAEVLG